MSTDRTMRIAQQLYEGIDLPAEKEIGHGPRS
jgi:DNA topoisomerase IA